MVRATRLGTVFVAVAMLLFNGCKDESSDGSSDSGPDEGDAGAECQELPEACEDVGEDIETQYFGCCFENSVYWCDDGQFYSTDCTEGGSTCAYNSQLEAMWCM